MNTGRKNTFAILMATIGCLIFNFNLNLAGDPGGATIPGDSSHFSSDSEDMFGSGGATIPGDSSHSSSDSEDMFGFGGANPVFYHITSNEVLSQSSNLLNHAISSRTTNVKGCPADLFVYADYGHMQEKDMFGENSYKNNTYGLVLGSGLIK
jgi:hypothetical protein